jgi:hypothetical protein
LRDPDPDPGRQKYPQKLKSKGISCLRAESFSFSWGRPLWRPRDEEIGIFVKKIFFSSKFF